MKPATICRELLGKDKTAAALEELSSPQIKATLKEGAVKVKVAGGYVSRQKKRKVWSGRVMAAIEEDNHELAAEFLQQWLLNHRRVLLIAFLDRLGTKHVQGETDDSFLLLASREKILESAADLLEQHDRAEVLSYLLYIAHQQKSKVFDDWDELNA